MTSTERLRLDAEIRALERARAMTRRALAAVRGEQEPEQERPATAYRNGRSHGGRPAA